MLNRNYWFLFVVFTIFAIIFASGAAAADIDDNTINIIDENEHTTSTFEEVDSLASLTETSTVEVETDEQSSMKTEENIQKTDTTNSNTKITKDNVQTNTDKLGVTRSETSTSAQLQNTLNTLYAQYDYEGTDVTDFYITITSGGQVYLPSSITWGTYVRNITIDFGGQTVIDLPGQYWGYEYLSFTNTGNITLKNFRYTRTGPNWDGNPTFINAAGASMTIENAVINGATEATGSKDLFVNNGNLTLKDTSVNNYNPSGTAKVINSNGNLTLSNFNMTDVSTHGTNTQGVIYSNGNLDVTDMVVTNSWSETHGGTIYSVGNATLTNVKVTNSTAQQNGGFIYSDGKLIMKNFNFTNPESARSTRGGAIYAKGTLDLDEAQISHANVYNNACEGGAIYMDGNGTINAVNVSHCWTNEAYPPDGGRGGFIYNTGYTKITNSNFTDIKSKDGGFAVNNGNLTIDHCNINDTNGWHSGILIYCGGPAPNITVTNNIITNAHSDNGDQGLLGVIANGYVAGNVIRNVTASQGVTILYNEGNCTFEDNNVTDCTHDDAHNNHAYSFVSVNSTDANLTIRNNYFENNTNNRDDSLFADSTSIHSSGNVYVDNTLNCGFSDMAIYNGANPAVGQLYGGIREVYNDTVRSGYVDFTLTDRNGRQVSFTNVPVIDGIADFTVNDPNFILDQNTRYAVSEFRSSDDGSSKNYILNSSAIASSGNVRVIGDRPASNLVLDDIDNIVLGEDVTITGTLTYADDTPIAEAKVTITISDENGVVDTVRVTTDASGRFSYYKAEEIVEPGEIEGSVDVTTIESFTYTPEHTGEYTVNAAFDTDVFIGPSIDSKTFTVSEDAVTITLDVPETVEEYVTKTATVEATVTADDEPVTEGIVRFTINGEPTDFDLSTVTDGKAIFTYPITEATTVVLTTKYLGVEGTYPESEEKTTDIVGLLVPTTTVITDYPTNPKVGTPCTIEATVTSIVEGFDSIDYTGNFTFVINGVEQTPKVDVEGGIATITITPESTEEIVIYGKFGDNTVYDFSQSEPVTITPTKTTAILVIDESTVTERYINQSFNIVAHVEVDGQTVTDSGTFTFTIGDVGYPIAITNTQARATFTEYSSEEEQTVPVTVSYAGTAYEVTGIEPFNVKVNKVPTRVTLDVPTSTSVDDPVTITATIEPTLSGYVLDEGSFIFIIDDEPQNAVSFTGGQASITLTPDTVGTMTISGIYIGDDYHSASNAQPKQMQVVADKTPTKLTIVVDEEDKPLMVFKPFDLIVTLTDLSNNPISEKPVTVTVTIDGTPTEYSDTTDGNGVITIPNIIPPNIHTIPVVAVFEEDDDYMGTEASISIDTSEITLPTAKLTVDVVNKTIFVDETNTIIGTVSYYNDQPVKGQDVSLTINDGETITVKTDDFGNFEYQMNSTDSHQYLTYSEAPYIVLAEYGGKLDVTYNSRAKTTSYVVNKRTTELTITADDSVNINETISPVITLTNGTDNVALKTVYINLTVDGETTTNIERTTSNDGTITLEDIIPTEAQTVSIQASFDGDDGYTSSNADKEITVNKLDTSISIDEIADVKVNQELTISATIKNSTDGLINSEGKVVFTINGETREATGVSGGVASITYTPNSIGDLRITAEFMGDELYYNPSSNTDVVTTTTTQGTATLRITHVDNANINKTGSVIAKVYVGDDEITEGTVIMNIDGRNYIANKTSEGFKVDLISDKAGALPVTASYIGINYEAADDSSTIRFFKLETQTTVSLDAEAKVNEELPITVTVLGYNQESTSFADEVNEGYVEIYVNGELIDTVDVDASTATTTYVPQDSTPLTITAKFIESDSYLPSQGAIPGEVQVAKGDAVINIIEVNDAIIGQTASIIVDVTVDGEKITTGNVIMTINGIEGSPFTATKLDDDGTYKVEFTSDVAGDYPVVISYTDDEDYQAADVETTVTINEIPTEILIEVGEVNVVKVPFDVTITLKDSLHDTPLEGQPVIVDIIVDNVVVESFTTNVTNPEGQFVITYTPENFRFINISARFEEDADIVYAASTNSAIAKASLIASTITVDVNPNPAYVDETITISGKLSDEVDEYLPGKEVILTIGEATKTTTTNGEGIYEFVITKDDPDFAQYLKYNDMPYLATVEFAYEADITNGARATTQYRVQKLPTVTEITVIPDTNNRTDITIEATVKVDTSIERLSSYTEPVEGSFIFTINGEAQEAIDVTGSVSIPYTTSIVGVNNITGSFAENEIYLSSEDSITFNVIDNRIVTNIDIEANPTTVKVPFDITITLTDEEGTILSGKTVKVDVINDGNIVATKIDTTGNDGKITLSYTPTNIRDIIINASFAGDYDYKDYNTSEVVNAQLIPSKLTVKVEPKVTYANQSVVISGLLKDDVEVLPGKTITITINEDKTLTTTTEPDGTYSITLDDVDYLRYAEDPYIVKAEYAFELDVTNGATAITTYRVDKLPTTTSIETITSVNNNTDVELVAHVDVNIGGVDTPVNVVDGFTFVINDGESHTVDVEDGVARYTYHTTEPGSVEVIGRFAETDDYLASDDSITFEVNDNRTATKASIDASATYPKMPFDITVTLTDDEDTPIDGASVVVKVMVDGVEKHSQTSNTADGGKVTLSYTPDNIHDITIVVEYEGNETYLPVTSEKVTKPELMPTTLTVDAVEDPSFIDKTVVISGTLTDLAGNIDGADINIYIDGTKVGTAQTEADGTYKFSVTTDNFPQFLKYNEKSYIVKAEYLYVLDVTNGAEAIDSYNVIQEPTTLELDEITDAQIGQTITITATLRDDSNELLSDQEVTIKVNGNIIDTKTTVNGQISVDYEITTADTLNIVAEFAGTDYYGASSDTQTVELDIGQATIDVNVDKESKTYRIDESVIISGTLADATSPIDNAYVKIYINDELKTVVMTDSEGKFTYTLTDVELGEFTAKAVYDGITDVILGDEDTVDYTVERIPTKTTVEVADNAVGNVTLNIATIDDDKQTPVTEGHVVVKDSNGDIIAEGDLQNGGISLTLNVNTVQDNFQVNVTYEENGKYLASNARNASLAEGDPNENITVINVTKIPTITTVEIVNTTLDDVQVLVKVTNRSGDYVTKGTINVTDSEGVTISLCGLDNGQAVVPIPTSQIGELVIYVKYYENDIYLGSTARNESLAEGDPDENKTVITVTKIPTITKITNIDPSLGNVVVSVEVTNATGQKVIQGEVIVKDLYDNILGRADVVGGLADIPVAADHEGTLQVIVEYQENDLYLGSNATNESAIGTFKENITIIEVGQIPTVTTVEIVNTTLDNVIITVTVTNQTGENVIKGEVYVKDIDGNVVANGILDEGVTTIEIPSTELGELKVIVEYQENDVYLASNATNSSALTPGEENYTVIDVTRIPTVTTVQIVNTTLDNVIIKVNVTNETGEAVSKGEVYVKDVNGEIIATSGELHDGVATIEVPSSNLGELKVIVEYQENDLYLASTATNSSALTPEEENYTVITVTQIPTITTITDINAIAGEVTISVKVTNETGDNVIKGTVLVKDLNDNVIGTGNLDGGVADIAVSVDRPGELRVIVEYQENDLYLASNATNESAIGTYKENITVIDVTKIPTQSSVEITNHTFNNVTIEVTVTNMTGEGVSNGTVIVKDTEGNTITSGEVVDGMAKIVIPTENLEDLQVIVEYQENDFYLASNATNKTAQNPEEENITKIDITQRESEVTAEPNNSTAGSVTVDVTVVDPVTGEPVTGPVVIKDEEGNPIGEGTLDDEGHATIPVDIDTTGEHTVTVEYLGNDEYEGDSTDLTIDVVGRDADMTANVPNATVGETTVNVTIVDPVTGEPIADAPVVITDAEGNPIGEDTTDGDGNVVIPVDLPAGESDITVTYPGDDTYNPISETITVDVDKRESEVTAEPNNSTAGSVTVDVTVIDPVTEEPVTGPVVIKDEEGNPIGEGTLDDEGHATIPVDIDTTGEHTVTVEYLGNDEYEGDSTDLTIDVVGRDADMTANVPNATVGETTVNVTIVDPVTGEPIVDAPVVITDEEGNVIGEDTTDGDGNVVIPVDLPAGESDITVTYPGDDTYNPITETITVDVDKRESEVTAEPNNSTAGSVTVDVTVIDPVTGEPVTGPIVIKDEEGNPIGEGELDENGHATIPVDIDTTGEHTVTIEYVGNDEYNGDSTDLTLDVVGRDADMTIDVPNPVVDDTVINVTIVDPETGEPIVDAPVVITDAEGNPIGEGTTDGDGNVVIPVDLPSGESDITVTYPGDDTYNPITETITVDVDKRDSTTEAKINSYTADDITVDVSVTDSITGEPVSGPIVITDAEGNTIGEGTLDDEGKATIPVDIDTTGIYDITITYGGNDDYKESQTTATIPVFGREAQITTETTNSTLGNTTVNVTLTDSETEEPLANASIIVTLPDGTKLDKTTNENGTVVLDLDLPLGDNLIVVEYPGNQTYNRTYETVPIHVEKRESEVTVEPNNNVAGDVTVDVSVVDPVTGEPVTGPVVIKDEDGNVIGEGTLDEEGKATIPIDIDTIGEHPITVEYQGNDEYEGSSIDTTIDVVGRDVDIDVDVIGDTVGNTTVNVTIVDPETGEPIPYAPVVITDENGTVIGEGTTDGDGNVEIPVDLPAGDGEITVTYPGDESHDETSVTVPVSVSKLETTITVNSAKIHIGEQTRVVGKITDENGDAVSYATINVVINDNAPTSVIADANGKFAVYYTPDAIGLVNISLSFDENDKYYASSAKTNISSALMPTVITVEATDCVVGESSTISGVLSDITGKTYAREEVILVINNKTVQRTTTDTNGRYEFEYTTRLAVTQNVTVRYQKVSDVTRNCSMNTTFEVSPLKTSMIVKATDVHIGENTTITGVIYDQKGNELNNLLLTVTINGVDVRHIRSTTDGTFEYSYKTTVTGVNNVTITYPGTTNYQAYAVDTTFNVLKNDTTITIDARNASLGADSKVTGQLLDVYNNPVKGADVRILVDGEEVGVATTNSNGKFIFNYTTVATGTAEVSVVFDGNDNYEASDNSTTITVRKIKTNLTVNSAKIHIGEQTRVIGKLVDVNGEAIANANIRVVINGEDYGTEITNKTGKFAVYYTPEEVGLVKIELFFDEDDTYLSSSAKTNISSALMPSVITVEATDCAVGESSTISGVLSDIANNPIVGATVELAINDNVVQKTTTAADGSYSFEYTTNTAVVQNVTVRYFNDGDYRNCSMNTTFNVGPLSTTIVLLATDVNIGENTTIKGVLIDSKGNKLSDTLVNININDVIVKNIRTDASGSITYSYKTVTTGVNNVTLTYEGSTNYGSFTESTTFNVAKNDTTVPYLDARNAKVGSPSKITGTITDVNANPVKNSEVNIIIDGEVVGVATTNSNGKFLFNYTTENVGDCTVTVEFAGNENYNAITGETTFTVRE